MENEHYPLDQELIDLLAETQPQFMIAQANLQAINAHRQGAISLFMRQHKLEGVWQVAENGKELVKTAAPAGSKLNQAA